MAAMSFLFRLSAMGLTALFGKDHHQDEQDNAAAGKCAPAEHGHPEHGSVHGAIYKHDVIPLAVFRLLIPVIIDPASFAAGGGRFIPYPAADCWVTDRMAAMFPCHQTPHRQN